MKPNPRSTGAQRLAANTEPVAHGASSQSGRRQEAIVAWLARRLGLMSQFFARLLLVLTLATGHFSVARAADCTRGMPDPSICTRELKVLEDRLSDIYKLQQQHLASRYAEAGSTAS